MNDIQSQIDEKVRQASELRTLAYKKRFLALPPELRQRIINQLLEKETVNAFFENRPEEVEASKIENDIAALREAYWRLSNKYGGSGAYTQPGPGYFVGGGGLTGTTLTTDGTGNIYWDTTANGGTGGVICR